MKTIKKIIEKNNEYSIVIEKEKNEDTKEYRIREIKIIDSKNKLVAMVKVIAYPDVHTILKDKVYVEMHINN